MIVWGGTAPTMGALDTGGRYALLTDTWTATSTGAGVPFPRNQNGVVWTGTQMIVWGGILTASGGVYCGCSSPLPVYRDLDGDGYGDAANTTVSCDGSVPGGYTLDATDCNDTAAAAHPGAPELCNGLDDDCDTVADDGFAVPGTPELTPDAAGLLWSAVVPSTAYDVVRGALSDLRSSSGDFTASTGECRANDLAATALPDGDTPPSGEAFWYLVRAVNCQSPGTWNSGGPGQVGDRDAEIEASANACP